MRLWITGGAGFIGSALARRALRADATAMVFDALTYASSEATVADLRADPRFSFVKGDIRDAAAVAASLAAFRPTAIAHLAAETHVDRSIDAPAAFISTNVLGTQVLLDAALAYWRALPADAAAAFRVLHVSTDEVFGELSRDAPHFTETTPYAPRSPYAASKAASDHLAQAWRTTYGLPTIVSNCGNNYGPYQFPEKLIPLTILNALAGKPIAVYGDGSNVRDWIFVDDHAEALFRILERGRIGGTYLVGARCERTTLDVARAVCAALDRHVPRARPYAELIRFAPDRPGHDLRYAIDPGRAEREFGWRPATTFDAAIDATVRWYCANEAWWAPLRSRYEGNRLGQGQT